MIITELKNRGILSDITGEGELETLINSGEKLTLYCGFDPTADSLHVGSMLPLMNLKRFKEAGHTVIALVGGATGLIGDPSFKAAERSLNTPEVVENFKKGIRKQIVDFLGEDTIIVDNLEWTNNMSVIDFLRDIGKHFSVNTMMNKESVKQRLNREGEGISFTEFSYQLLQGMDFLKLKEKFGCSLQIGGSDQMGNITAGTNLIHRSMGNSESAFGLTTKLLTKSNGEKFGKSETGTVWLSGEKTSPFEFFQFWLKTADSDVYDFLRFFSKMSVEEIAQLQIDDENRKPLAQEILANEVTLLIHGQEGLDEALKITNALIKDEFGDLSEKGVDSVVSGLFCVEVTEDIDIVTALVDAELAKSKRIAREFINNNSIKVNGEKVTDVNLMLKKENALFKETFFIKRGKRNLSAIKFV